MKRSTLPALTGVLGLAVVWTVVWAAVPSRSIPALGLGTASADAAPAAAERFEVDAVHSSAVFRIKHFGVAYFYGRFNEIGGSFWYDASDPASSRFEFTVSTESVDTNNDSRDRHLKSPDFFNARENPTITFHSTRVEVMGPEKLSVRGDLTLHGQTREVTAAIEWTGARDTRQGYKRGFETTFNIKRSEFGMTEYLEGEALGDEVRVVVSIEGVRRGEE